MYSATVPLLLWLVTGAPGGDERALSPLEWQYRWEAPPADGQRPPWLEQPWDAPGWHPLAPPKMPPRDEGELWLRARSPPGRWRSPALRIDFMFGHFDTWLDGQPVYSSPAPSGAEFVGFQAYSGHLIELPPMEGQRMITFRTRPLYPLVGFFGVPTFGDHAALLLSMLREQLSRLAIAALMLLLAALSGMSWLRSGQMRLGGGFALFSACGSFYLLFYAGLRDVLAPAPTLWFLGWYCAIVLAPVGLLDHLDQVSRPSALVRRLRRFHLWLAALMALVLALSFIVVDLVLGTLTRQVAYVFATLTMAYRLTVVVSALFLGWHLLHRARHGEPEARWFLGALLVLLLTIGRDIVASLGFIPWSRDTGLHWGLLAVVVVQLLTLQRRYGEARASAAVKELELRQTQRERELLLRDLHDGLGGVTTSIRLLAELGRRGDREPRQALDSIAELSNEGLAELRSVMDALEEEGLSWQALEAELRSYGSRVIEARGQPFRFTSTLDAAGEPGRVLCLAVLRIFREALTNVAKHAGQSSVEVALQVSRERFSLSIRDDGAGPSDGSRLVQGDGRGLENMKARARELGGQLEVVMEQGTEVCLVIPLRRSSPSSPEAQRSAERPTRPVP